MKDGSAPRWRFIYLLNVAQRRLQAVIQAGGQTATRAGLLMALSPDRDTPMSRLGEVLDLAAPAISNLVERAVRARLIERKPDPEDGRAWMIKLTKSGLAKQREAITGARELNAQLCEGFTDAELEIVARWLETVRSKFAKETP